jgi:hypothetical protein
MADERVGTRDFESKRTLSWTEIFRTFLIALDPFKLLVAAGGILATSLGWWLLSVIFFNGWTEPKEKVGDINDRKSAYQKDGKDEQVALARATADYETEANRYRLMKDAAGPGGSFRKMPWFEDRGRNPFLLARSTVSQGTVERRAAVDWFLASQAPVLVEPLLKFLSPIIGLFDPEANFWVRLYLFFLIVWMLLMWAFFGGIITRMAIVQIAGKEGGGLRDAVRFVKARYLSYVFSPIVPILLIFAVVIGCIVFGLFHLIPLFGDILVDGVFWWIPLGAGFIMTLLVVGLVGYPLMYTTLSAEGSDTFDALSRSYNYVYESPWHYLWYAFLAIVYGAVVVFFVVFWSSLMVYLGKWGVSQTPFTQSANRAPEYLFIYTPTSFGWRELMLKGSPVEVTSDPGAVSPDAEGNRKLVNQTDGYYYTHPDSASQYMKEYSWYNYAGAGMVSFWMTLLFMLMLGFSYSYFWTAASMIYLLMRKKVDEVEVDEIYTEEEEIEEPVAPPKVSPAAPSGPAVIPVDAPTLRVATPAPAPASSPGPAPPEASTPPPTSETPPAPPDTSPSPPPASP